MILMLDVLLLTEHRWTFSGPTLAILRNQCLPFASWRRVLAVQFLRGNREKAWTLMHGFIKVQFDCLSCLEGDCSLG